MNALYAEAVEVSNAASAFEDLREFDETVKFVEKIQNAQSLLLDHILKGIEKPVIEAAASGAKYTTVFEFKGAELFEGHSILFMLLGGAEHDRRAQLDQFGFEPLKETLTQKLKPFGVHHLWEKATNSNSIALYWE